MSLTIIQNPRVPIPSQEVRKICCVHSFNRIACRVCNVRCLRTTSVRAQEEELTEAEKRFRKERGGGNYGLGTKEVQEKRYIERREAERKRRELFSDALAMYKKGHLENVRAQALEPLIKPTDASFLPVMRPSTCSCVV